MGVAIPQVITEDRASGAQIVDSSLKFNEDRKTILERTTTRSAANAAASVSVWVKRSTLNSSALYTLLIYESGGTFAFSLTFYNDYMYVFDSTTQDANGARSDGLLRDTNAWYHVFYSRSNGGTDGTLYINGVAQSKQSSNATSTDWFAYEGQIGYRKNGANRYYDGYMSELYVIDGQQLSPNDFGYTDPLTNTWRPKKYTGTYGDSGFYLPFDGSAPIGQDQSGNGNNWTPTNFGGSNTIEKATGALPILNTDGGGKVARVGVRTDAYADNLVLALPLVGNTNDVSNSVNSGSITKTATLTNSPTSSFLGNFYGGSFQFTGSNGQRINYSNSADFDFGTSDFTVEGWYYRQNKGVTNTDRRYFIHTEVAWGGNQWILYTSYTGYVNKATFYTYPTYSTNGNAPHLIGTTVFEVGNWYHIAVTRSGNTFKLFVNGILEDQADSSTSVGDSTNSIQIGGGSNQTDRTLYGNMQDVRIYKGVAKYTSNFIPASTDPDILPDSPSGVSYSSNVALVPSTDGAVSFDGSGDYLSLASSTDFELGSGDFTVECYVNFNDVTSSSGYSAIVNRHSYSGGTGWGLWNQASKFGFWMNGVAIQVNSGNTITTGKWYHVAAVRSGSTVTLYVDGISNASTTNSSFTDTPSQPLGIGIANVNGGWNAAYGVNGFISNLHIVKGTALYTSNFTPPSAPISSVENTKLLCCKSNSSTTAADVTPGSITANGNATATNFNPFTDNINTQRGKTSGYATLNPLHYPNYTLSNGNLSVSGTTPSTYVPATINLPLSGKFYFEYLCTNTGGSNRRDGVGIVDRNQSVNYLAAMPNTVVYFSLTGIVYSNNTTITTYPSYDNGDVIQCAVDCNTGNVWFGKNGIFNGSPSSGTGSVISLTNNGNLCFAFGSQDNTGSPYSLSGSVNFGQKPFKFPLPAGFQPLTLANTPRPTITRPGQYVGVVTYSGTSGSLSLTTGFKPDLVWVKTRGAVTDHEIYDSVRGAGKRLSSNQVLAENNLGANGLTSFDNNGFTVPSTANYGINGSGYNYVAWAWKAGGNSNTFNIDDVGYDTASAAGLDGGSTNPTGASVNTKSKFGIYTFDGTSANRTMSHGLGQQPDFMICKKKSASGNNWVIWHKSFSSTQYIMFTTAASATDATLFNSHASDSSTLWTLGSNTTFNETGQSSVAYLWAETPGFSKFGNYTGNGSADGPVITTGFRPRWVLTKRTNSTGGWVIIDSERDAYNVSGNILQAESSAAELSVGSYPTLDILSNGFKVRSSTIQNASGGTYIYAAFAEAPGINLYGAQANAR